MKLEIAKIKKSFYNNKVKHLKNEDCTKWWRFVTGYPVNYSNKRQPFTIKKNGTISVLTNFELAKHLNTFFLTVNVYIFPPEISNLPAYLPTKEPLAEISDTEVS